MMSYVGKLSFPKPQWTTIKLNPSKSTLVIAEQSDRQQFGFKTLYSRRSINHLTKHAFTVAEDRQLDQECRLFRGM
jgi:hypothetical protein